MAKGIVITEKNYNMIAGKLERFFRNKPIMTWHTFNGGMRKRIPVYSFKKTYYDLHAYRNKYGLQIRYGHDDYYHLFRTGQEIWFLGNRIIIKEKWIFSDDKHYSYTCYQIAK